jgi:hypothetical protein
VEKMKTHSNQNFCIPESKKEKSSIFFCNFIHPTVCARDCDHYEEKNARRQSEECALGNMIACRETQMHAGK